MFKEMEFNMLDAWQNKFPLAFADQKDYISKLTISEQLTLSEILEELDHNKILNNNLVANILVRAPENLSSIAFLVKNLCQINCLNEASIAVLLSANPLHKLVDDFKVIDSLDENLKDCCVDFFKNYSFQHHKIESLLNFISHDVELNGLIDAMQLFKFSSFKFTEKNLDIIKTLSQVLANPLSATIFDARLRCFSDYSQPTEPLQDIEVADLIINELIKHSSLEVKIHKFFDYFAEFRPCPESQKYMDDIYINVDWLVRSAIEDYCEKLIQSIKSQQDYQNIKKLVIELKTKGGNKEICNSVKYQVASAIESEDYYSFRSYTYLMSEILPQVLKPQSDLDVSEALEEFDAKYKTSQTALIGGVSFFNTTESKVDDNSQDVRFNI